MSVDKICFSNINFRQTEQTTDKKISSDFVRMPYADEYITEKQEKPKKKNLAKKIFIRLLSAIVLTYGSVVLFRKLSKPSFDEVQRCFREIFEKDLSADEVKELVNKYKEICKKRNTDEFTTKMIEQLKKDYGIEEVKTELTVTKLKDGKLSTALDQKIFGEATPLGKINIMPNTNSNNIIRSIQGETFVTGFHELKHMKQFADAYRANPDKFAEVMYNKNITQEMFDKSLKEWSNKFKEKAQQLHDGDESLIKQIYEEFQNKPEYRHLTKDQIKEMYKREKVEDLEKMLKTNEGIKTDSDIPIRLKENWIKSYREALDERFGKLEKYKEGTKEYNRGMEYIEGYEKYTDPDKDFDAYKESILEKEAFRNGDLAKKIYKYTSSIWKI